MVDKNIIRNYGKELEEVLKNSEINDRTKVLLGKAMDFGYTAGICEERYQNQNDPYSSSKCLEMYERVRNIIKN